MYETTLSVLEQSIDVKTQVLNAWAEHHPEEFNGKKSIEFAAGKLGFRTGTPKLELLTRKWNWKKALEKVQELLPAFIRKPPEIDKEAIIAKRDDATLKTCIVACGLKVTQDETFFVEPTLTEVTTKQTVPAK